MLTRIRLPFDERAIHSKMWSSLKKIFQRLFPGSPKSDHSTLLPHDVDKLRAEFSSKAELDGPGGPLTAREAFELALEVIHDFDPRAKLSSMASEGALDKMGRAEVWVFVFHLPERWGHAHFNFCNQRGRESVTLKLVPFAPAGSALDKMLQDGQSGFVEQQWKVELERQPSLTHDFVDSGEVLAKLQSQGKSIDFLKPLLLKASTPPLGKPRWELYESPASKKSLYTIPIE